MKGQLRPPLDVHDIVANNCTFCVSVDWDAAQIMLQGLPTGAAGGASLVPAPGVEMLFDRADGHLSQVIVDAGEPGGSVVPGELAVAYISKVLGCRVGAAVLQAPRSTAPSIALRVHPIAVAALSRLARLDAARRTSPVPSSPLWAVEAAQLARQAGFTARARTEARRARAVLAAGPNAMPWAAPEVVIGWATRMAGHGPARTRHTAVAAPLGGWTRASSPPASSGTVCPPRLTWASVPAAMAAC